ncbi:TRAP transporter substrate-binding protein DctP [Humitalea sp. 24SJ18S-53]|uniref:TRAP transporter substrate-binding protein DctP n=1 Tax=Humitalea sp. 24SJ18S-53 TaxID=3422307 RepID=UPI003D66792F
MIHRRGLGLAIPCLLAAPAVRAATTWSIVTEYPATSLPGEGIAHFAQAATGGDLTVTAGFDAPGGLRSASMPRAVADGVVAAADAFAGAMAPAMPLLGIFALPFLTASAEDARKLWALTRVAVVELLSARGLRLLYVTPWPPAGIWSRNPVTSAADLAGLRVRTFDATSTATFSAAGATAEAISFADALPRVRAGTIDAVLSSGDGGAGARLWESLPHFTRLDWAWPLSLAFCGNDPLSALPASAQIALGRAAQATETRQWRALDTRIAENATRMATAGVRQIEPDASLAAALRAAAGPVTQAWARTAGAAGADLLDQAQRR